MRWDRYNRNLPGEVVKADAITTFKKHMDRYIDRKGLEGTGQMFTLLKALY